MIAIVVTTAAVAAASAFVPAIPIEAYLVGVITTTGADPVAMGIAAGLGQTAGKLLTFLAARGVIRSSWLRRWLGRRTVRPGSGSADGSPSRRAWVGTRRCLAPARECVAAGLGRAIPPALMRWSKAVARSVGAASKRLIVLLDRPVVAAPTVFLSALIGIPPLLVTSVYAARTPMPAVTFGAICLVGLSIRFIAIALLPQLVMN
jgi:membrane protein YqaA with SNARE-associated domain